MSDIFKAIADPTRRQILLSLAQKPENINTISEKFDMSRPAVSKHIKILNESKLVRIEKDETDSRQRNCFAQLEALYEVNQFLEQLETFWKAKLSGLDAYLSKEDKGN